MIIDVTPQVAMELFQIFRDWILAYKVNVQIYLGINQQNQNRTNQILQIQTPASI
jgi:hypothetical protein